MCHPSILHKHHSKTKTSQTRPLFHCSGNRLADPTIVSKVAVESAINALTPKAQAAICPRQKWAAVDLHQAGLIEEALALLRPPV